MTDSDKEKRKLYPPSNTSSHYYTDPCYSSEGFYGFEEDYNNLDTEGVQAAADLDNIEVVDEPVESWGWINNVDDGQFKQ